MCSVFGEDDLSGRALLRVADGEEHQWYADGERWRGARAGGAGGDGAGAPGTGGGAGTQPTLSAPAAPLMLSYTTRRSPRRCSALTARKNKTDLLIKCVRGYPAASRYAGRSCIALRQRHIALDDFSVCNSTLTFRK